MLFNLLCKSFSKANKLHNIFNQNTVKISYSRMRNMGSIVSAHNQRLLIPDKNSFGCNKSVEHKCLTQKVIHQADVTNDGDNEYKFYYGLTE